MTLVAVLGGGQLGQMLALAGIPLGLRFRFLDPDPQCPAGRAGELVVGAYDDPAALRRLVQGATVATFEFENVPHAAAAWLEEYRSDGFEGVFPSPRALEVGQDRAEEKTFFRCAGVPTTSFATIDEEEDIPEALSRVGLPAILKTRRFGYDGKGQVLLPADVASPGEAVARAWRLLDGVPCILEGFVDFRREVSTIAVRGRDGAIVLYAPIENVHRDGILRRSRAPLLDGDSDSDGDGDGDRVGELERRAEDHAISVITELGYVGALCIEFFERRDGTLVANEFAPRVHNSGHWTIEAAATSQFENHLRAILGWPLGPTALGCHVAMVNLIGDAPPTERLLTLDGAAVHLYGKAPRPGRKLGHVTVMAGSSAAVDTKLLALERVLGAVKDAAASR